MRMSKFMRISADADPDAELRYTSTSYCRYIDDIFIVIENFKQIENLKSYFEEHSKLSFT